LLGADAEEEVDEDEAVADGVPRWASAWGKKYGGSKNKRKASGSKHKRKARRSVRYQNNTPFLKT
jgi:hypothetical protein